MGDVAGTVSRLSFKKSDNDILTQVQNSINECRLDDYKCMYSNLDLTSPYNLTGRGLNLAFGIVLFIVASVIIVAASYHHDDEAKLAKSGPTKFATWVSQGKTSDTIDSQNLIHLQSDLSYGLFWSGFIVGTVRNMVPVEMKLQVFGYRSKGSSFPIPISNPVRAEVNRYVRYVVVDGIIFLGGLTFFLSFMKNTKFAIKSETNDGDQRESVGNLISSTSGNVWYIVPGIASGALLGILFRKMMRDVEIGDGDHTILKLLKYGQKITSVLFLGSLCFAIVYYMIYFQQVSSGLGHGNDTSTKRRKRTIRLVVASIFAFLFTVFYSLYSFDKFPKMKGSGVSNSFDRVTLNSEKQTQKEEEKQEKEKEKKMKQEKAQEISIRKGIDNKIRMENKIRDQQEEKKKEEKRINYLTDLLLFLEGRITDFPATNFSDTFEGTNIGKTYMKKQNETSETSKIIQSLIQNKNELSKKNLQGDIGIHVIRRLNHLLEKDIDIFETWKTRKERSKGQKDMAKFLLSYNNGKLLKSIWPEIVSYLLTHLMTSNETNKRDLLVEYHKMLVDSSNDERLKWNSFKSNLKTENINIIYGELQPALSLPLSLQYDTKQRIIFILHTLSTELRLNERVKNILETITHKKYGNNHTYMIIPPPQSSGTPPPSPSSTPETPKDFTGALQMISANSTLENLKNAESILCKNTE